ncbi:hypothetical protein PMAC_003173 [Pneumocystis sp. 'macacae']|nr:hypothetical protein PMAC_003173 [Pneumocystis sp. 'macacae']
MDPQTKNFDEKEEYKKLFKIRDEIFMNMQTAMQSSGIGVFNANMPYGSSLVKGQLSEPLKSSYTFPEETANYKHPVTSSTGISTKDEKNRLERALRARIEKRKADIRLISEQGPPKKHIEQRAFSNQIHYKRNKEPWDGTRANAKGLNYDTLSNLDVQKGLQSVSKHLQESSVSEPLFYHTEKPKNDQITYCENKDELATNFLSNSMAIPGLRIPINTYEENTEKSATTPTTTQNMQEKSTYNEDVLNNSSPKSLNLPIKSKLISNDSQTYKSNVQSRSRSSSFEYKPRSPNSHLHLSPLLSPKISETNTESQKLKSNSTPESKSHCSQTTNENPQNAAHIRDSKAKEASENYIGLDIPSNHPEQHNHRSYKEIMSSKSFYWKHDLSPYYNRSFIPPWYGIRDYPGPFPSEDDPYIHYRDRAYFSALPAPPVPIDFHSHGPYYPPDLSSTRHPSFFQTPHPYLVHPLRFSHSRPLPHSPPLPFYQHPHPHPFSSHPHFYPPHSSLRYDDSSPYSDPRYFYPPLHNFCDQDLFHSYNPPPPPPSMLRTTPPTHYSHPASHNIYSHPNNSSSIKHPVDHPGNWPQWTHNPRDSDIYD